jgi:acetyltransferase
MYREISELPAVPDLAVALIPAKFVPDTIEACGRFGVKRMAIPSGGFNELGGEGQKLADLALEKSRQYGIRFVGPNGVTIANTENGLCLPFVPSFSPPRGGLSIISQSGGVGLMLWNFLTDEKIGMAKFASIGNKLDLDEVDFLEYFGRDPETKVICMYLESIPRGQALIDTASKINKPIIILKANTTEAGKKAAMSHTAALSNNDEVIDTAFEKANIVRIHDFNDFISMAKAFELPPLNGNKLMVMSPAGGFTVMMADLCEKVGFEFADPGKDFFAELKKFSNAGVINFTNPLDMGDIYDPNLYAHIFYSVMHNEKIDGAVYVSQWPHMPRGEDVFYKMFHTDLSKETIGTILSSGKPLGVCLFGLSKTISRIKQGIGLPLFNSAAEMINSLKKQADYHQRKNNPRPAPVIPAGIDRAGASAWLSSRTGAAGEESLDLLSCYGITAPPAKIAESADAAAGIASEFGFPVVMKVVSPDAVHKSDAGGVIVGIDSAEGARAAFNTIKANLEKYKPGAVLDGVRVVKQADDGYDLFIGGVKDPSFGPVIFFGLGGIYIEIFKDAANTLCPADPEEIRERLSKLKAMKILSGARGQAKGDIDAFLDMVVRVSWLMADHPEITELDINPVRVMKEGGGALALDARVMIVR